MARRSHERTLKPSLLDRLIDDEPRNRTEAPDRRSQSMNELKDSVRRDLEWLLNSRRPPWEPAVTAKELWRSVYCYGLPDTTAMAMSSAEDRNRMVRMVSAAVAAFEPRLMNVRVNMEPASSTSRVLHFQIEALLRMEPSPARVFFDTTLELTSGEYAVAGDARAR
ncbi:MAG: type VI secretion system baseplate subunit TssE [Bryobacteraceae bacterium]|jgi:type VI secretion system protein ImpF